MIRVLHTIAGLWSNTGGPAESVPALCEALAARGNAITLLTGTGYAAPAVRSLTTSVRLVTRNLGPYWSGNYSRSYAAECRALASESDVLHTHGMWLHPNLVTSAAGRKFDKPVVVSPRGMLSSWALKRSALKKRIVWHLGQRRCLSNAALIHVTSSAEAAELSRLGLSIPVAIIPNGLSFSAFPAGEVEAMRSSGREQRVLFLSRIHPKKGLDLLLDAWRIVVDQHRSAELLIAGPGEAQHINALREMLANGRFAGARYIGPVEGPEKLELLARSTAVVLPSHDENYGMVVAEALVCGTPVVVTRGVPWGEVETSRCGWWVRGESPALASAIGDALSMAPTEIDEMGRRGRSMVERSHTIEAAAFMMESAYSWVLGRVGKPGFVEHARATQ